VPQKPQRPFVPHRTPTAGRSTNSVSEFRLYIPFVPGGREIVQQMTRTAAPAAEAQTDSTVALRPIEDFLDTSPAPASNLSQDTSDDRYGSDFEEEPDELQPDELPPVEHFTDPLPGVEHFAPNGEGALLGNVEGASVQQATTTASPSDPSESGWIETDWQHYDWRAAARLGESGENEASNAWATTDWDGSIPRAREQRESAAHAIATALDEIARRIRDGELAVPRGSGGTDPAAIAATLAAILGVKR
jgi:hypothetical protein